MNLTNAVKYGAPSDVDGELNVECHVTRHTLVVTRETHIDMDENNFDDDGADEKQDLGTDAA
jgi:two-component sensor histidine kinase